MADEESDAQPGSRPFHAKVRQVYALPDRHLLILEEYRGDVGAGDQLSLSVASGSVVVTVRDLAWGSAFSGDPPLTLIVDRIEGPQPESGATLSPA